MDKIKNKQKFYRHVFVALISLFLVLLVLANYGSIVDLTADLSYFIDSEKRGNENKRLTQELIALYGSQPIEYYNDSDQAVSDNYAGFTTAIASDRTVSQNSQENLSGNYLYIPNINISAPIIAGTTIDDDTILNQLKEGVLMYPGSVPPGNGSSTVIIGHSSSSVPWHKYGRVFSRLPEMAMGDMIIINYDSKKYSYKVIGKNTGSVQELSSLDVKGDLILGTCWPIGTDEQRILVTATLVTST